MNYIWDVLLKADWQQIPREEVQFRMAKQFSPYMEVNFENINTKKLEAQPIVEINPYYRFYSIFKNLFLPDFEESPKLREVLLDIMLHFLAEVDLKQGLCKREYFMRFIARDLISGMYGIHMKQTFCQLSMEEQEAILKGILHLYTTNVSMIIFKKVMRCIFKNASIYQNQDEKDEVLLYVGERKSEHNLNKLQMICEFFLPLRTRIIVYWEYHFSIMNVDETNRLDEIALY